MKFVNALGLVLGVIGGILAYLSLGPASGIFFIWATFIFTATGVALGGTKEAFKNLVVCGVLGVVLAWVASLIVLNIPLAPTLTLPVWAGIVVGATTSLLAVSANLSIFPAIPATVIGYASTFAYLLSTPGKLDDKVLLGMHMDNPLFVMVISFFVAAAFGLVSLNLTGKLAKPAAA
jgi:hypothetical protein